MALPPSRGYQGPQVRTGQAPLVNLDSGQPLMQVSDALFALSGTFGQRASIERKRAGLKAGALSGSTAVDEQGRPAFIEKPGSDEYSLAYNEAAMKSYATRLNLSVRQNVAGAALKYRADPEMMQKALSSWAGGVMESVPVELRAAFEADLVTLAQPQIMAAYENRLKAKAKSDEGHLIALRQQVLMDSQANGRLMAAGGKAAELALGAQLTTYGQAVAAIQGAVDGVTYTQGQATAEIGDLTSSFVARSLMGGFDGSSNPKALFTKVLRGEAVIPVPGVGKDGNLEMRTGNALDFMTPEDQERVRTYMQSRLSAERTMRDQSITDYEKAQGDQLRNAQRELALTGDSRIFSEISQNPQATFSDIEQARSFLVEGTTDPGYFRQAETAILAGTINDIRQLDPQQLGRADRKKLADEIQSMNDGSHWRKSQQWQQAEKELSLGITGLVSNIIQVGGVNPSDRSQLEQRAAANLTLQASQLMDSYSRSGMVGRNRGDAVVEYVEMADPETGATRQVERFDPVNWARQKIQEFKTTDPMRERLGELKEKQGELLLLFQQARGNAEEQNRLREQQDQIGAEMRELRRQLQSSLTEGF